MSVPRMDMARAVDVVHKGRRDEDVVISSMGSAREWMKLGPLHERDFVMVPSAMGHATSLGLGIALDRSDASSCFPATGHCS